VLGAGVKKQVELRRRDPEQPFGVKLAGERRCPPAVVGVGEVVLAHRVVQKREKQNDLRVHIVH